MSVGRLSRIKARNSSRKVNSSALKRRSIGRAFLSLHDFERCSEPHDTAAYMRPVGGVKTAGRYDHNFLVQRERTEQCFCDAYKTPPARAMHADAFETLD